MVAKQQRQYLEWSPRTNVPLEFVGKITGTSPMAKASHIKCCAPTSRHDERFTVVERNLIVEIMVEGNVRKSFGYVLQRFGQ